MQLDHVTIAAPDCDAVRDFFVEVAGLTEGPRPPFGFEGYWLYLGEQAVIHLIGSDAERAAASGVPPAMRIDHFALRVQTADEWRALLERLQTRRIPYHKSAVPLTRDHQIFVQPVPGVTVEFVTAGRNT